MTTTTILGRAVLPVIAIAILSTGCSVKATPPPFEAPPPAAQEQPAGPAPESVTTTEPVPVSTGPEEVPAPSDAGGAEPSDGGGEAGGIAVPTDVALPKVFLAPEKETTVTYLRGVQDFSPELEIWSIDGTELHYQSYNCVGSSTHEAYATLVDNGDLTVTARWEGDAPGDIVGWSSTTESVLQIEERTLRPIPGGSDMIASTRSELELRDFTGMCTDAGKQIANFVL